MVAATSFLAISGGVGGAKLALGLSRVLPPSRLTIVANTGDDFEHLGLHISPDLDTLMYTLAGLNDSVQGWGLAGESWHFLDALERLGGESWFRLGDRDLATHLLRSQQLRDGASLSEITAQLCTRLGVEQRLLPMSDDPVRTMVQTEQGLLPFQHYFVREQCRPRVSGFRFDGAAQARPQPALLEMLRDPGLAAIVLCPSNPFVSIDPLLAVPGVRQALIDCPAPVIAVSPIVDGIALKGPAAKMMAELGVAVGAESVAAHYRGLVNLFVLDTGDAALAPAIEQTGMDVAVMPTIMGTLADREELARRIIELTGSEP